MKTLLLTKLKKWIFLVLIGCSAYFIGYAMGNSQLQLAKTLEPAKTVVIENAASK